MKDFCAWVGLIAFILMCINYKKHHKKDKKERDKICLK